MKKMIFLFVFVQAISCIARGEQPFNLKLKVEKFDTIMKKKRPHLIDTARLDEYAGCSFLIGAGFDFLDGLQVKNIYSSIDLYVPPKSGLGSYIRISEYRSFSVDSSLNNLWSINEGFFNPLNDSISFKFRQINKKQVTKVDNLSLSYDLLRPSYINSNTNLFHWALHAEIIRRNFMTETEAMVLKSTDITGSVANYNDYKNRYEVVPDIERTNSVRYDVYLGVGALTRLDLVKDKLTAYFRGMAGGAFVQDSPNKTVPLFYLTSFQVKENILGLTFGGEIRGLLVTKGAKFSYWRNYDQPYIYLFMAKSFPFNKIGELFKI